MKRDENFETIFCKVEFILVNKCTNDSYFIFCEEKAYENKEIGLYELSVIQKGELAFKKTSDFLDLTPHYKFVHTNGKSYVCVKHAIPN